MNEALLQLDEPEDYFTGIGKDQLPIPTDILLFLRTEKKKLQQEALQNRSHHRFILCFNHGTEGHIHVDNLALPFMPGQAMLILPYQFHHFSLLAAMKLKWLFCTFELEPRTFLEPMRNRVVDVGEGTQCVLEELLKKWHASHPVQLQAVLLQLLISMKRDRVQAGNDIPPESEDNLLRSVNRLMAEFRGRTVVVADLAEAIGFSDSRLRVLFKETAGIPLGGYIQNYRINRAMALLHTTDLSITDVAEEAGFGSPQAFSRVFKKETGQTPRSYRNQF